jgi:hypothetical protein
MALYLGILTVISLGAIIGSSAILYVDNSVQQNITDSNYNNIQTTDKCDSTKIIKSMQTISGMLTFSRFVTGFILFISILLFIASIGGLIYFYTVLNKESLISQLKSSYQKSSNIFTSKFLYFVILCIICFAAIINTIVYGIALGSINSLNKDCFATGTPKDAIISAASTLTYQVISNVVISIILIIVIILMIIFGNLGKSLDNLKSNLSDVQKDIQPHLDTAKQNIQTQIGNLISGTPVTAQQTQANQ